MVNHGGAEVNEGDVVNEGNQAVNKGGEAVNKGGEDVNVSEVHVQQDYNKVELTPLDFDASRNGEPGKRVGGEDAPGNSIAKALTLD
ncbi:unnamed protein product [Lactuca saligna]|uniref:Uncharacterized protein n=1 Tax=Lactuca saligna TaxID=75948 RepID=A0AA35ZSX3_LACSI|nr:unnamed protein product [Lactuca saligna]